MLQSSHPIAVFDSGCGGLTVLKELQALLPHENYLYFADTAHLPYGEKSQEEILGWLRAYIPFFLNQKSKLLVIACHTASSHALHILKKELALPVIGVTEAAVELARGYRNLAVLATQSTIDSGFFQRELTNDHLWMTPCPLFVPLLEERIEEKKSLEEIAKKYLSLCQNQIDAALLACTHYPLLSPILQKILGPHIPLLNPARKCAEKTLHLLKSQKSLQTRSSPFTCRFFVTDQPEKFHRLSSHFSKERLPFPLLLEKNGSFLYAGSGGDTHKDLP